MEFIGIYILKKSGLKQDELDKINPNFTDQNCKFGFMQK